MISKSYTQHNTMTIVTVAPAHNVTTTRLKYTDSYNMAFCNFNMRLIRQLNTRCINQQSFVVCIKITKSIWIVLRRPARDWCFVLSSSYLSFWLINGLEIIFNTNTACDQFVATSKHLLVLHRHKQTTKRCLTKIYFITL